MGILYHCAPVGTGMGWMPVHQRLKEEWGIDFCSSENDKDTMVEALGDGFAAVSFIPVPIPNGEAEDYASANYMWPEATDVVKSHKAQILIAITGNDSDMIGKAKDDDQAHRYMSETEKTPLPYMPMELYINRTSIILLPEVFMKINCLFSTGYGSEYTNPTRFPVSILMVLENSGKKKSKYMPMQILMTYEIS